MSVLVTFRRAALVGTVAALALTACSRPAAENNDADGDSGSAATPIQLAVGIDASYAPFYLADETGKFADAGLDVTLVQFGRGGEAVDALASDTVQLAGSSDTTTIGQLQANPSLRALLSYEASGEYLKVVLREGVADAAAVQNVGIVPGLSEISAVKYLQDAGVDPGSVNMITATPTDMPALMARGDIDAFVLWEPWPAQAVSQGTGSVAASTGDYDWTYKQWLITTDGWLSENEEVAAQLAAVLSDAADEVEADPDAAADATVAAVNLPAEQTLTAVNEIDFAVTDLTDDDITAGNSVSDFYVTAGTLDEAPDLSQVLLVGWWSEHRAGS